MYSMHMPKGPAAPSAVPEDADEIASGASQGSAEAAREADARAVDQVFEEQDEIDLGIERLFRDELFSNYGTPRSAARFIEEHKLPPERIDRAIVGMLLDRIPRSSSDYVALDVREAIAKYPRAAELIRLPEVRAAAKARVLESLDTYTGRDISSFVEAFFSPEEFSSMLRDTLLGFLRKDLSRGDISSKTTDLLFKFQKTHEAALREDPAVHAAAEALLDAVKPKLGAGHVAHRFFDSLGLASEAA